MTAAAAKLGRFPSRREYDRWRADQPRPDEFASATFIRRAFNDSWTEALGQLGAPTADYAARRLLTNGKAFTSEELERALRLFAAAYPPGIARRQTTPAGPASVCATPGRLTCQSWRVR